MSYVEVPAEETNSLNGWAEGPTALLGTSISDPVGNNITGHPLNGGKGSRRSVGLPAAQRPNSRSEQPFDWSKAGLEDPLYSVIVPSNFPSTNKPQIPGSGSDCGNPDSVFTRRIVCSSDPSHFHYDKSGNSCGKPLCPRHWKTWALRASSRIAMRVNGFREASHKQYAPTKVILSVPDDSDVVREWEKEVNPKKLVTKIRNYFIRYAGIVGVTGGSIVIHPYRTNDNVPLYLDGEKRWDWVRKQGDAWSKYVKFSPHAHIIGYGFLKPVVKGSKEFKYKNMGRLDTVEEIESVSYYNLSHAGIVDGVNAVSYFGCCSFSKLKQVGKTVKCRTDVLCPTCGSVCVYEDSWDESNGGKYLEVAFKFRPWARFEIIQSG